MSKVRYILKRLLLMLLTLFIIFTLCFVLIKSLPQPAPEGNAEQVRIELERRELLGYNKPIMEQYFIYLRNILRGSFGVSWRIESGRDVASVLFSRIPPTLIINLLALLLALPTGLLLGIFAALKKDKWQDRAVMLGVMLLISVPSYVYAFLLQYVLYYKAGLFPPVIYSAADAASALGVNYSSDGGLSIWLSYPMLYSMTLPVLCLSLGTAASLARFVRAELVQALGAEYMLFAKAQGLSRWRAVTRHAMRNALVPVLPMLIGEFASVLSGSLIIERIFGVPGVGALYLTSVQQLDYDVFLFVSMFYTFISLFASVLVDISYGFIDPRMAVGVKNEQ